MHNFVNILNFIHILPIIWKNFQEIWQLHTKLAPTLVFLKILEGLETKALPWSHPWKEILLFAQVVKSFRRITAT